ncbi:hypothetical protein B0H15DRAFT_956712 [Mycena belliarum]|uniref:Uncharacterized protein n=1 Tax=Mycena belliarum TaxID=1033014 RepID=A0AAD6TNV4_9AGAR|nr:hypothetical protein B0H15DRAFT_956712 [Mycena belliae]
MNYELTASRSRPSFNQLAISLSSFPAVLSHTSTLTPSFKQENHDRRTPNEFVLRDNLFDYQDPWNAIGVILGLEKEQVHSEELGDSCLPELLVDDHPGAPDEDVDEDASVQSALFSNTSSSNYSRGSSPINSTTHETFDLFADDVLSSFPLTPARSTLQAPYNDAFTSAITVDARRSPDQPTRHFTPNRDGADADLEPLTSLLHYSSSSPLSPVETNPRFSPDDCHDRPAREQTQTPSPVHRLPPSLPLRPSDPPPLPKFAKFPSPLETKCRTTHTFTPTSRHFKFLPRLSPKLERPVSLQSANHISPLGIVQLADVDQPPALPHLVSTQRPLENPRVECRDITEVNEATSHGRAKEQYLEESEHGKEGRGTKARQPEKFFGELCLFSDDMDDPESDD